VIEEMIFDQNHQMWKANHLDRTELQ